MNATTSDVGSTPKQSNTSNRAAWACLLLAWLAFLVPIPFTGLFVGWPLNLVAFILAIVAMSKRGAGAGIWPLLASLVASPIIYFIANLLLVGTAVTAVKTAEQERSENQAALVADTKARTVIATAGELVDAYRENKVAADQRFKGKRVQVSGVIHTVSTDFHGAPMVELRGSDFDHVQASGLSKEHASTLKKGQSITFICVGDGEIIGSPKLAGCVSS